MKEGANIVVHSFDVALFSQKLKHDFNIIKAAAGDVVPDQSVEESIIV
jgi:hypothetical protein